MTVCRFALAARLPMNDAIDVHGSYAIFVVVAVHAGEFGMILAERFQMFPKLTAAVLCSRKVIREHFCPVENAGKLLGAVA